MHYVSRIDPATAQTPRPYQKHSTGFRRSTYVDHTMGSVHMGVGVCYLDPAGVIQPHRHSFEESFFILEGNVIAQVGDKAYSVNPGNFGLIGTGERHAFRNASDRPVRWEECRRVEER